MTSTNIITGLGDNGKTSSKVLRPPGGGSSDIFGSETPNTPRAVRNHMASNIFGSTTDAVVKNSGDAARRAPKNVDSYSRLFGEPERPFTPAKNHMKSSIPIGPIVDGRGNGTINNTTASIKSNVPAATNGSSAHVNGNGIEKNGKFENGDQHNNVTKTDGNPVTGEGYKPAGAEINTSIPCLNGANQVINKNRIPPGGYSSGLW